MPRKSKEDHVIQYSLITLKPFINSNFKQCLYLFYYIIRNLKFFVSVYSAILVKNLRSR